jgi:hypothetical protein
VYTATASGSGSCPYCGSLSAAAPTFTFSVGESDSCEWHPQISGSSCVYQVMNPDSSGQKYTPRCPSGGLKGSYTEVGNPPGTKCPAYAYHISPWIEVGAGSDRVWYCYGQVPGLGEEAWSWRALTTSSCYYVEATN